MKRKIPIDPISSAAIGLISGLGILAFGYQSEHNELFLFGASLYLFSILRGVYIYFAVPGEIYENNYNGEVCVLLKEYGRPIKRINPGETAKGVDGIKTSLYPNKVYIVRNGIKVRITETGEVAEYTLLSKMLNSRVG